MQYYPFDSRNPIYRQKIGALAEGETLRLRLLLHKDAGVHTAYLNIREDGSDSPRELMMTPAEWLEDYRFYDCSLSLTEGLYWYSFRYTSDHGEFFVTKTETSLGIVSNQGQKWQQTVYAADFNTPEWLSGGIIYQIFPDRFAFSGEEKQKVPGDRYICTDWQKQPEFRQNTGNNCFLSNDYYRGDLKGITQKLDYLASLSVRCIYLNPVFEAHSNHRYNTADYMKLDPLLGDEKDLEELINEARKRGIAIIFDGVFSHTGDDSLYFNKKNRYEGVGAYQSPESPYSSWYNFYNYPEGYNAWWGIKTLPETNENDLSFAEFITGPEGVVRYWLKKGIKGWRLDVADELPDEFLKRLRLAVKAEGEDNFLLGEVWEDASNKISYGARRKFLLGKQLDSVMNYPFANAIVDFVRGGSAEALTETVLSICENYPPAAIRVLMNHIGTHDTPRILTRLGSDEALEGDRSRQSVTFLSKEQYGLAKRRLKLAAVLQYTLPGVPSVFYGDEAGVTGYGDPFCRATYPWGREDTELLEFYRMLGEMRKGAPALKGVEFVPLKAEGSSLMYLRKEGNYTLLVAINRGDAEEEFCLPDDPKEWGCLLGAAPLEGRLLLGGGEFSILTK